MLIEYGIFSVTVEKMFILSFSIIFFYRTGKKEEVRMTASYQREEHCVLNR